ncbi:hypothetical protein HU200_000878 [Digitaria exilis]|uniref:DOMON domain-containing protein n=1 Tax=Digitaria exilis TaxID=1010633 RepID=A0A835G1Z5_9POAL|nr:hypothetical protein HU200_000878 [Digitaria exilis]
MASATQQHRRPSALVLAVLLAATAMRAAAAAGGCEGDKFAAGRSYAHCVALPHLGARLHWTYDPKTGSLSVAFVAKPASPSGWVSWAINPTGDEMKGAQALLALRSSAASAYVVSTYNITGYAPLGPKSTAIAFKPTGLAADEAAGEIRLYGKLQLPAGTETVNHIWQVGSAVNGGAPVKHAFDKDNTEAKGKLALSGAAVVAPAPAPDAAGGSSPAGKGGSGGAAPSSGKPSAAEMASTASALLLMVLALAAGFLAIV